MDDKTESVPKKYPAHIEYQGLILRMGADPDPSSLRNSMSPFVNNTNPAEKRIMLKLARAAANLGIGYEDHYNIYLSFGDPWEKREFKIPIKESDPARRQTALKDLREALEEGIRNHNSRAPGYPIGLDRLAIKGNELDFAYSLQKQKLPR